VEPEPKQLWIAGAKDVWIAEPEIWVPVPQKFVRQANYKNNQCFLVFNEPSCSGAEAKNVLLDV